MQSEVQAPRRPALLPFVLTALIAPTLLALFAIWLGNEYFVTEAIRAKARAALEIGAEASSIISRVCDAESSQRGYVITGDTAFINSYRAYHSAALKAFDRLDSASASSAPNTTTRAELRRLSLLKFAEMDAVIANRRTNGFVSAASIIQAGYGKALMDRMRHVSDVILTSARQRHDNLTDLFAKRLYDDATWTLFGIGLVGIVLLASAMLVWRHRLSEFRAQMMAYGAGERNRAILDSTVDGIVIFDGHGTMETVNAAAGRLLGDSQENMIGRDVGTLVKQQRDLTAPIRDRFGMVDGDVAQPFLPDRQLLHHDGHEVPVDIALGVMRLPDGDHFVASFHDISERKRSEQLKDDLISTVSHELRTPLTSVVGALGLLRSGAAGTIDAAPARLIEIAENNSRRLIRLINDMLDIDRIQSGQLTLVRQRIDLRDVVSRACEGSSGTATAAEVSIACDLPSTPVHVLGDADRLLQVVSNLASNAIRVSMAGSQVHIGISVAGGTATLTVDDDGPGVAVEFRDRIFGRFERADRAQGVGAGLGLAISREIIARHDGRIWFEDRPGGGTRFAASLALYSDPKNTKPILADTRVLMYEDNADIAETVCIIMERMGFYVECVSTVAAARAALQERAYDVLLLDINLPDETGLSLLRSLQGPDGELPLPVIILSAEPRGRPAVQIPEGILDWIEKPVDSERLRTALNAVAGAPQDQA